MKICGKVHHSFWYNGSVRQLSDIAKLLAVYLLSSHRTNALGCFRILYKDIVEDLGWSFESVSQSIAELTEIHFLTYDAYSGWVLIHDYLKWNPTAYSHQEKYIKKLLQKIPKDLSFFPRLMKLLSKKHHDLTQIS